MRLVPNRCIESKSQVDVAYVMFVHLDEIMDDLWQQVLVKNERFKQTVELVLSPNHFSRFCFFPYPTGAGRTR